MRYLRFVAGHVVRRQLTSAESNCGAMLVLARELLVSSVMVPVINLVSADNINNWILLGFRSAQSKKGGGSAEATPGGGSSGGSSNSRAPGANSNTSTSNTPPGSIPRDTQQQQQQQQQSRRPSGGSSKLSPMPSGTSSSSSSSSSSRQGGGFSSTVGGVPPLRSGLRDRAWQHLFGARDETAAEFSSVTSPWALSSCARYYPLQFSFSPPRRCPRTTLCLSYVCRSQQQQAGGDAPAAAV